MALKAVCEQMERTPPWAEGLLLRVDGYETEFYKKDRIVSKNVQNRCFAYGFGRFQKFSFLKTFKTIVISLVLC